MQGALHIKDRQEVIEFRCVSHLVSALLGRYDVLVSWQASQRVSAMSITKIHCAKVLFLQIAL